MKSFASLTCTILVLLLLVIVEDINAAAVGKGAVGAGGRSVKGMRYTSSIQILSNIN